MRFIVALGLIFLGFSDAAGQPQPRRLTVLVEDPSGATIPRASIIVLAGSDLLTEQTTDSTGVSQIQLRTTEALKLIVTAEGFSTAEVEVPYPPRATTHPSDSRVCALASPLVWRYPLCIHPS